MKKSSIVFGEKFLILDFLGNRYMILLPIGDSRLGSNWTEWISLSNQLI